VILVQWEVLNRRCSGEYQSDDIHGGGLGNPVDAQLSTGPKDVPGKNDVTASDSV
jgi:hypothetical protein